MRGKRYDFVVNLNIKDILYNSDLYCLETLLK